MFSHESAEHNGRAFVTVGDAIKKIGEILIEAPGCLTEESITGLTSAAFQLANDLPEIADME